MKKKLSPIDKCKLIKIDNHSSNGNLGFFNFSELIPFQVKRLYYVNKLMKGSIRGNHAHLKLEQFIFLLNGAITINLEDGIRKKSIYMEADNSGIYLSPMIWRYIRNYNDFMQNHARKN